MSLAAAYGTSCFLLLWADVHPMLGRRAYPASEGCSLLLELMMLRGVVGRSLACLEPRREASGLAIWVFEFQGEEHLFKLLHAAGCATLLIE